MKRFAIGFVFAALVPAGAYAATPAGTAFFRVTRVHVQTRGGALGFDVAVTRVPPGNRPTLAWSLAPSGGTGCGNAGFPGGTRSRNGLVVWDQQGPSFRWSFKAGSCTGRVSLVAENQYEHCTATVVVKRDSVKSAAPVCAIGGYAIGFSTLPVPAGVFAADETVRAQLARAPRTGPAAARAIRSALRAQQAALALFPPVWFCSFTRIFAPIAALRADFDRRGATAARDARAANGALAACAPAAVRTAFARLAASPSPTALTAALAHFPTVFGFRFADLVNAVAVEEVALAGAQTAAGSGNVAVAAREIATASSSAHRIGTELDHYQRGVERVENAHG